MPDEGPKSNKEQWLASLGKRWWLLTLPLGLTTWAAFIYTGSRTKRKDLIRAGAVYAAALIAGIVLAGIGNDKGAIANVGGGLLIAIWIVGMTHALVVKGSVERQLAVMDTSTVKQAQQELDRRAYGRQLLKTNPSLARQLGVGRPDVAGSDSFGLIDVNHADRPGLLMLPGLTDEHAQKILDYRNGGGSFVSVEDTVMYLDLPSTTIGPLRDRAVFDTETF